MSENKSRGWLGGPDFIKLKKWKNGMESKGARGRRKTRMYYSGLRKGAPNRKHENRR